MDADFKAQIANLKTFDDLLAGRILGYPEAQVYRLLLVASCNYYRRLMPFMFERLGDATELLLPEDLLTEHSIVHDFRTKLADVDCRDVEVVSSIGLLGRTLHLLTVFVGVAGSPESWVRVFPQARHTSKCQE